MLYPEGLLRLNRTGAAIVAFAMGGAACRRSWPNCLRSFGPIPENRAEIGPREIADDVGTFLEELDAKGLLAWNVESPPTSTNCPTYCRERSPLAVPTQSPAIARSGCWPS